MNKCSKEASKPVCEQQEPLEVGIAQVHRESTFALSLAQVVAARNELERGGEIHLVTQLNAHKLQICQVVDSLVRQCDFAAVIKNAEIPASILLPERCMQALELTIPAFQDKFCFRKTKCWNRYMSTCGGAYVFVMISVCRLDSLVR